MVAWTGGAQTHLDLPTFVFHLNKGLSLKTLSCKFLAVPDTFCFLYMNKIKDPFTREISYIVIVLLVYRK